jgi:hypothetical protein
MNSEERKLEAWKLWVITQGVGVNDSEATLKNSPAGKVFSNAWDAAMVYAKSRLEDFVQDVWSKRVAPEGSVHDLAIYHAPFDVRSYNCLRAEDIKTIGELLRYTENDLLKIPNMGRKSAKSIIEVLDSMGLKLKGHLQRVSEKRIVTRLQPIPMNAGYDAWVFTTSTSTRTKRLESWPTFMVLPRVAFTRLSNGPNEKLTARTMHSHRSNQSKQMP